MRACLISVLVSGAIFGATPNFEPARLPLLFEPNLGQADSNTRFVAHSSSLTVLLDGVGAALRGKDLDLRVDLVGADFQAAASGVKPRDGVSNYLRGNDRSKWVRGVPHFGGVSFQSVYKGIDAVYYGAENTMEYDFDVAPGVDPSVIRMQFSGAKRISLDASGDLRIDAGGTSIRMRKPVAYQEREGVRKLVAASYRLKGRRVEFQLGHYDPALPLVIDPLLDYVSYYAGLGRDSVNAITSDAKYTYVASNASSAALGSGKRPIFRPYKGGGDVAITRVFGIPQAISSLTFVGGSFAEGVSTIAIGPDNTIWIAGLTFSQDYPVTNNSTSSGGAEGFLTQLDQFGQTILFSTYLGGSAFDRINGLGFFNGGIVVAGETDSPNFPITASGALSTKLQGPADGFVTYFQPSPDAPGQFTPTYSTYLGGSGRDVVYGLVVSEGNIILTGDSNSTDYPTTSSALSKTNHGGTDVFVSSVRLNGAATQLTFSTYIGGTGDDHVVNMKAAHLAPGVVIGGYTNSPDFPITPGLYFGAYQGKNDGFVMRLDTVNGVAVWSTYLGGGGDDYVYAVEVDNHDGVWAGGGTASPLFPPGRPIPPPKFTDGYVLHLDPAASNIGFIDSLSGEFDDRVLTLRLDASGNLWGGGDTFSQDLPTTADALFRNGQPDTSPFVGAIYDGFYFFLRSFSQGGSCDYELTSPDDLTSAAQTLTLKLTTSAFSTPTDNCPWRIVNGGTFTTIDGPDSGIGHATINVKVPKNDTKASRQAAIYVGPRLALIRQTSLEKLPAIFDGGVVGAALSVPSVRRLAFNGLFTVFGTDFAPSGTALGAQLVDGALSTIIGGVCVTFNGDRLPMINVFPGQITAVAPSIAPSTGDSTAEVRVVTQCDTPNPVSTNAVVVPFGDVAPEFLYFKTTEDAGSPVAAVDAITGAPIGPSDLIPGHTSPAKPGGIVTIYAVGFGDVSPSVVQGQPAPGAAQVKLPAKVFLNGKQVPDADVLYCGVTVGSVGLYQLNLQLAADTPAGKLALKIQLGTQESPAGAYLTVGSK